MRSGGVWSESLALVVRQRVHGVKHQRANAGVQEAILLAGFFGRDEEDEEPAPRRRPRRG